MAKLQDNDRCWVCGDLADGGNIRTLEGPAFTVTLAKTNSTVCDKPECQKREKTRLYDMSHRRKDD